MGHRGSKKTQQQRLDPRDTCGRGQVVNGFHGDPTRGHRFWLYPREKPLVTERWDTHLPAIEFCKNHRKVMTGEYVCKGHIETEVPRVPSAGLDDDADDAPTKQKLATLAEMGFVPSSARRALDRHGGDVSAAALALVTGSGNTASTSSPTPTPSAPASDPNSLQLPLMRMVSVDMVEWWCNDEKRSRAAKLEEYERARETISIADHWMHSSSNAGLIRKLEDDARRHNGMADSFERTALDAIRYAWSLDSDKKARSLSTDVPSVANGNMYNGALQMHNALSSHDKKLVHLSLSTLTRRKVDSFELQLVIGYMRRGADECNARKKWVVGQMINVVARADSEADSASEASAVVKAHDLLVAALWKEIDDLKELAFETVFITPTVRYFEEVGDSIMAGDTDVHGANTYLGLLMATLGIRLNRLPLFHDEEVKGVAPFLDAKGPFVEKWLPALWDRSVLGHKPASSVRATVQARVARNAFYFSGSHPFEVANNAIDHSERSRPARQRFAA